MPPKGKERMTPGPATPVAPRKRMTGASRKKTVCFAEHGARTDHRLPGLPEPTGQYYIAHVGRKAGAEASPDLNSTDYAARLELIAVRPLNLPKDYVTSNVVISWRNWHHIDATLGWDGFCPTKHPLGEAFRIGQALSKDKVGEDVSQSLDATLLKSGKSAWKHFYVVCQGRKDASKPGAPGLYLDIVSKVLPDPYKGPDSCARLRAGGPESYHTSNLNPIFEADIKDFNRKFGLHSHGMPKAQLPAPHRSPSVSPGPASSSSTAQPACPEAPPRALAYQSTTSTRGTSTPPSIVSAIQAVCGPDTAPRGRSQERNPGGSAFNSSVRRRSPSEEQVPASSNRRSSKQRAQSCSPARVFSQTGTAPEATHRGHQMSPGSARSETQTDRGRLGGQRARSVPRGLPQNDERYLRGASQPRPPLPSPFTTDQDTRPGLAHGWTVLNPPRAAVANTAAGQKRGPSTSPSRGSRSPERRGLYGQQRF